MKGLLTVFLIFFNTSILPVYSFTDYPGFKPVPDLTAFKKKFATAAATIQSIQGDFVQEKNLLALTEKIVSKGKIWFKSADKVRMDYLSPFAYKMIINGDKMYIQDDQKENRINVRSNKLFRQINHIMIDCMKGSILESSDFTVRAFENESAFLIELTPVSKNLSEFFQTIVLITDKKDNSPHSIELIEPLGDKTVITLSGKTINRPVQDELFLF